MFMTMRELLSVEDMTDDEIDVWFASLSDGEIDELLDLATEEMLGSVPQEYRDAIISAYTTFGLFGGWKPSAAWLKEKAENQLRDDAGRWRRMLARIAHKATRGKIGKGLPLPDKGIESWTPNDPLADLKGRAKKYSQELYDKVKVNEPAVSSVLKDMSSRLGGTLAGFEFRRKNLDSTFRKLITKATDRVNPKPPEKYGPTFPDALRYTMLFKPKEYMGKTKETLDALEAAGHKVVEKSNMWSPDNTYKGINVKMQTPDGLFWELQFHTPDSYRTKDRNHLMYEVARSDNSTPLDEAEAEWRMHDSWRAVEDPAGWDSDPDSLYEKRPPSKVRPEDRVPDPEERPVDAFLTEYMKRVKEAAAQDKKWAKDVLAEFEGKRE
jgi:hypothetical protein